MGTTLLHEEINRLFAASSFGVIEEDGGTARLKSNPKKGADRWAMFVLRVECERRETDIVGGEGGTKGKAGLEGDVSRSPGSRYWLLLRMNRILVLQSAFCKSSFMNS